MLKLPKFPKGLKARIAKQERIAKRKKDIDSRRRQIESDRKKLESLKTKNRR